MRQFLLAIAISLSSPIAMSDEVSLWATAISRQESTGRAVIFRYAREFHPGFKKTELTDRIILVWKYKSESGMPSQDERELMDKMEDLIEPFIKSSKSNVLTLVSTGENLREWIFYSKSEQDFIAMLNIALSGQPVFPIEIHAAADPEWATYERFRKGVKE